MNNTVQFRKITEYEFNLWKEDSLKSYANDLINAGQCSLEEALERATSDFEAIMTEGLETPNNFIYIAENIDNEAVGLIWYEAKSESKAFIADFLVYSNHRGKGYGKSILNELEVNLKKQGIKHILLHVFEKNTTARELYKKVGYVDLDAKNIEEGSIYMVKTLI